MEAAYLGLATTYWKQGQWDDVMQPLQRALDLSPQDPEAHAIFADMLFRSGDTEVLKSMLKLRWREIRD